MNKFLRTIIGLSVILLALSVTAISCNKVGDDKNNANNSGSGSGGTGGGGSGGGNNGGGGTVSTYKGKLGLIIEQSIPPGASNFTTVSGDVVYIDASNIARYITGPSQGADGAIGFDKARTVGPRSAVPLINFTYDGVNNRQVLFFVTKPSVTTNELAMPALSTADCRTTVRSETGDNTFAATPSGAFCRSIINNASGNAEKIEFFSYFGTVFNNTATGTARGAMGCDQSFGDNTLGTAGIVGTTKFTASQAVTAACYMHVIRDTGSTGAINDAWVDGTGGTATEETELYVVGVNISDKSVADIAGALGVGSTLADLNKAWDNAAIKNLLSKYEWRDLKFKLKIVKSDDYSYAKATANTLCGKDSTKCLELAIDATANGFTKVVDKTNIVVNAAGLANVLAPHSDADDADRSFEDVNNRLARLFKVNYPGAKESLTFVNRKDITTNSMAFDAAVATSANCTTGSESADETYATRPQGGHCIVYMANDTRINFYSYLGTLFNNTNPTTHARGIMRCWGRFQNRNPDTGMYEIISDTTVSRDAVGQTCSIAMVNNAGGAATEEIDDNWVDNAGSTKEIILYAVGIDITGKPFNGFLPAAANPADNFSLAKLTGGVNNATFKKILEHNNFKDLAFKVTIVKSANY